MNISKTLVLGLFALIALVAVGGSAEAYFPATPYSGMNTMGTVWSPMATAAAPYGPVGGAYDYIAPARAGGQYGDTTAFLTGLRAPIYAPVQPTYYTNYYQQVCSWPYCTLRGAGYPRATASQFPHTGTPGGVFSY